MLHAHYVFLILHELRNILKRLPNINIVSTHQSKCVTVVGDLHGSLADLMVIFHKVLFRTDSLLEMFVGFFSRTAYRRMRIRTYSMVT